MLKKYPLLLAFTLLLQPLQLIAHQPITATDTIVSEGKDSTAQNAQLMWLVNRDDNDSVPQRSIEVASGDSLAQRADSVQLAVEVDSVATDTLSLPTDTILLATDSVQVEWIDSTAIADVDTVVVPKQSAIPASVINAQRLAELITLVDSGYPQLLEQGEIVVNRYNEQSTRSTYKLTFKGKEISVSQENLTQYPQLVDVLAIERLGLSAQANLVLWQALANQKSIANNNYTLADTIVVNRLFLPLIYSDKLSPLRPTEPITVKESEEDKPVYAIGATPLWLERSAKQEQLRKEVAHDLLNSDPSLVQYSEKALPAIPKQELITEGGFKSIVEVAKMPTFEDRKLNMGMPQLPHWKRGTNSSMQLSQIYISDNWYQGGQSNLNLTSSVSAFVNYDNLDNIKFSNSLLWKLGLNNAPEDTVHSMRVNEDLFRLQSSLGVKAFKSWYYSLSALFNTQLFNSYKPNSDVIKTTLLSPSDFNLGLGMQYGFEVKSIKMKGNLTMSPLTYNLRFVADTTAVPATNFGIEAGKRSSSELGSSFEYKMSWVLMKDLSWNTRLYYYTNYERMLCDFENSFDFVFNRYFSTRLFLHLRYDDSIKKPDVPLLQAKELISFGFNYKW